jgi:hypothetical protein
MASKRYDLFSVKEAPKDSGKKNFWSKLGVAYENKDGSFSLHLDGLPIDGKLQMRVQVDKESKGETFE